MSARIAVLIVLVTLAAQPALSATSQPESATLQVDVVNCLSDLDAAPLVSTLRMNDRQLNHAFLDGPTPLSKAQVLTMRSIAPGVNRFVLRLPPGNYEVYAKSQWCSGQTMAVVLARRTRSISLALAQFGSMNMLFDHDHASVAGTLPIAGLQVVVRNASGTYGPRAASVQDGAFYVDSLQRLPWIIEFRAGCCAVAQFPLDLTQVSPGDYALVHLTPEDVIKRFDFHGELFSDPFAIASEADGSLWYTNPSRHSIGVISDDQSVRELRVPSGADPMDIAAAGDGSVWFTERGLSRVGWVNRGHIIEVGIPDAPAPDGSSLPSAQHWVPTPFSLVGSPDGSAWIIDRSGVAVDHIRANGVVRRIDASAIATDGIAAIAADTAHGVWFVTRDSKQAVHVTDAGLQSFPLTAHEENTQSNESSVLYFLRDGNPSMVDVERDARSAMVLGRGTFDSSLASDESSGVWLTECEKDRVSHKIVGSQPQITTLAKETCPTAIIADGSGGAWFFEAGPRRIAHLSAGGTVVTFTIPSGANVGRLALGGNGMVWFPEMGVNKIGYVRDGKVGAIDLGNPGATPGLTIVP